mmetsp:Transcript_14588/g.17748  ORF Transcript_14588/g.17748 Transcript_14588/m.17748 type:complete len:395 (-) Transcript_14588:2224-3408(-)
MYSSIRLIFATLSNYSYQAAFAISPIPAYLPQYWTLCNTNDPVLQRRKSILIPNNKTPKSTKENRCILEIENITGIGNGGGGGGSTISGSVTEGGFSSTSIMILLLSHAFRLQYFLVSAIVAKFSESSKTDNGNNESTNGVDKVQFDLLMQSLVMIGMQLLLLSAVTRRRRLSRKKKIDDSIGLRTASKSSSLSQKPFIWLLKPRQNWEWDTVHQHLELCCLMIVMEFFISRYYLHPYNAVEYIRSIKNISVFLESCLALPQIILNYRRKSTNGLSLLMVMGWVIGDMLKLAYFISARSIEDRFKGVSTNHNDTNHGQVESGMVSFMVGCIFALLLDSIVVFQMTRWYPTLEFLNMKKKLNRSYPMRWFVSLDETPSPKKMKLHYNGDENFHKC